MVNQDVALADRLEDVDLFAVTATQCGRCDRAPLLVTEVVVAAQAVDLPEVAKVKQAID